jgi:iron complex outermembrane receptor protein
LNAFYENSGSFVDFVKSEAFAFYPVLRFDIGENTTLTLEGNYLKRNEIPRPSLPTIGTVLPSPNGQIPRSRYIGEPSIDRSEFTEYGIGYRLEHKFSDDWSIKNNFNYGFISTRSQGIGQPSDIEREFAKAISTQENYNFQVDLLGKVETGFVQHNLLFGVEYTRGTGAYISEFVAFPGSFNVFQPIYGNIPDNIPDNPGEFQSDFQARDTNTTVGIYLISFGKQVKLLLGGRFDWNSIEGIDLTTNETSAEPTVSAFSPRIGIVYQPIEPISLYASYSSSFLPSIGTDRLGNSFKPITGQQFEVGVKGEFFDGKASATLAAFDITQRFRPRPCRS